MKNVLLTIEYDGSAFHGWQEQPGLRTVQGTLQEALSKVIGFDVHVNGTSRTDAGVHALGQCCSFSGDFGIPVANIKAAVNNLLSEGRTGAGTKPGDIRIVDCREVPEDFHARFDCKGKTYRYILSTGQPDIFRRNYCYFVDGLREAVNDEENDSEAAVALDVEKMREAAGHIVGVHDFACFQSSGGTPRETTVRTIYSLKIITSADSNSNGSINDLVIEVTGDGFLYNMVRIIVGTLVEVGLGKREPDSVSEAIEAKDRRLAGHTAPAEGLYLAVIYFDKDEIPDYASIV